jgi:hypothetical protein
MLPNQHIKTAAAIALALSVIAPTAASARPIGPGPGGAPTTQPQATPIVRIVAPNHAFDWGDAAIGAGGGLALSMLGLGGALAVSSARTRRSNIPGAPTT